MNFRSYAKLNLPLDGRSVALAGPNGAGKTNILEALSLFGPGRGLRSARLDELPRRADVGACTVANGKPEVDRERGEGRAAPSGGWGISIDLHTDGDTVPLGVGAEQSAGGRDGPRRVCRIDGSTVSGPSAFADHLRLIWLTPAQDRLFMDAAGERRRFLDRMTQAHDPAHARMASAYETAMRQRQKLLETGTGDDAWLVSLETQMAEAGVAIAAARRETAAMLMARSVAEGDPRHEPFPRADISLAGALEAALETEPAADVEDAFCARLKGRRAIDRDAGRATDGPHRSDLIVVHRDKGTPARLCSTGEQKALLIGLVLANARALAARPDGAPLVLLLDEIAAHLDEARRAALFDILHETRFQCFMTGTDHSLFAAWGTRAQHFTINQGSAHQAEI